MCLLNVLGTPRHSVQADEITFNAAISACEKTDRWDMAPSGFEIVQGCAGHGVVKHLFLGGHVFGAGHLGGSRLLSFFAFYYENNIVWGGGVGWDNNVTCTSTHM